MLRHSQAEQIEALHNIVDLLVPEPSAAIAFAQPTPGKPLRENMAT